MQKRSFLLKLYSRKHLLVQSQQYKYYSQVWTLFIDVVLVSFIVNFKHNKSQSFLELKTHCSVAYGKIVLCLFSRQADKVDNFSTQQLPKNGLFLMSFFNLCNDAFCWDVLKTSDLHLSSNINEVIRAI